MAWWHRMKMLWRNLARKREVSADLDEEIRAYQAMLEDEHLQAGADLATARRLALLETGGAQQIKEEVSDIRLGVTLETVASELRQSLRGLRRNPSLTLLAILMLALGMGASITVFSIFQAALLQPMPFREPDRLVELWETRLARNIDRSSFSLANFWDVHDRNHSFEELAAYRYDNANLTGVGEPQKVSASSVSTGFLRTLGVAPVLGRDFVDDDVRGGSESSVALLGNAFWKQQFNGDANVIGRTLRLGDRAYTVVGVLPRSHVWLNDQIYIPFGSGPNMNRGSWEFSVIGRLAKGVSLEAASIDLEQIAASLDQEYPQDNKGMGFLLGSANEWVARTNTRLALWVLLGAVGLLMLIACLNVANLLLARGTARHREIAIRAALGADRTRLTRFVMMESLLLSALGALLGLGIAFLSLRAMQTLQIQGLSRLDDASLNPWVLGAAVFIALMTGLLAGLAPAVHVPNGAITGFIRDGERQTGGRGANRLRAALVTGEVALSFVLLVGAGLLIRSFTELVNVNHGFQSENRMLFSVNMPSSYWQDDSGKQFIDRLLGQLEALPDTLAVGSISHRPVEGGNPGMSIATHATTADAAASHWAGWRITSPGYFRAIGLPLLRGRLINDQDLSVWRPRDKATPARHVVISAALAALLFPNEDAVGKQVVLWKGQSNLNAEVVGVVGNNHERGLADNPALTVYIPYGPGALTSEFVIHTRGNPSGLAPIIRSMVAGLDPRLPVADLRSFDDIVHRSVSPQRLNASLLGVFSGMALILAMIGIYGVLSYSMSHRTAEIGLRVALGASRSSILRTTVVQGMRPALPGILLGAIAAWWLSQAFANLLFGIKPFDPLTYAAVTVLLSLTALAACYLPARRAMRIDPAVALRAE